MSGEAYNNVQGAMLDDLIAGRSSSGGLDDLIALREDIWRALPDYDRAPFYFDFAYVVARVEETKAEVETLQKRYDRLHAPLKAFNYWQSADSDEAGFRRAVAKYRDETLRPRRR